MLAKCIWKMYQIPSAELDDRDRKSRPSLEDLIAVLEKAVEVVAALPKPRHGQDPILEPHYKIVSITHKLVLRGELPHQKAANILQRQPYAIQGGEHVEISEPEDWEPFVIKTLTHLREKDRSNWQHRIIMRHARILFDETSEDSQHVQAIAAFQVLSKSMLTKTMVMNVWKCDAERPGRHHVYTEQYVRFVVRLLTVLKDRTNFELLLRRLRKKGADYYHFNDLWQFCCVSYLRLIRQAYHVKLAVDDEFKATTPEEFEIIAARVSDWASVPTSTHAALSALLETVELKKLNAGLMKAGAIDDLISDCYTAIYFEIGKSLPGPSVASLLEAREKARLVEEQTASTDAKATNPFSNILNPPSRETPGAEAATAPVESLPGPDKATAAGVAEGSQRPRRAGIRRADIIRKAEQTVLRAQEGPATKPSASATTAAAKSHSRSSLSSSKTPAADEDGVDDDDDGGKNGQDGMGSGGEENEDGEGDIEMRDEDDGDGDEAEAEAEADGDRESSVHDSADDESDLSDVPPEDLLDEDEAQQLMFPNLIRRSMGTSAGRGTGNGPGSGSDADDDEDDEDEDGDDGMDDDGDEAGDDEDEEMEDHEEAGEHEDEAEEAEDEDDEQEDEEEDVRHEDERDGDDL